MSKQTTIVATQDLVLVPRATFAERMEQLRAARAQLHYDAALEARSEFEARLVASVRSRVQEVLDAVTGG